MLDTLKRWFAGDRPLTFAAAVTPTPFGATVAASAVGADQDALTRLRAEAADEPQAALRAVRERFLTTSAESAALAEARDRLAAVERKLSATREQVRDADDRWNAAVAAGDDTAPLDALRRSLRAEVEDLLARAAVLGGLVGKRSAALDAAIRVSLAEEHDRQKRDAAEEFEAAEAAVGEKVGPAVVRYLLALARFQTANQDLPSAVLSAPVADRTDARPAAPIDPDAVYSATRAFNVHGPDGTTEVREGDVIKAADVPNVGRLIEVGALAPVRTGDWA